MEVVRQSLPGITATPALPSDWSIVATVEALKTATTCLGKVLPVFNRCVIFSTTDRSYHGQPEPLRCPQTLQRNSVALYYYKNDVHGGAGQAGTHNTIFRSRPGESAPLGTRFVRAASGGLLKDVTPPILYRALRRLWNRQR